MDKLLALVVPNTAKAQRQCCITQVRDRYSGKAYVDGLAIHVQAASGNATPTGIVEHGIRGRATVAGNHLKSFLARQRPLHLVEEVEELRIQDAHLPGIMITQQVIERHQGIRQILAIDCINQRNALTRVGVIESQAACAGDGRHRLIGKWQGGSGGGQPDRMAQKDATGIIGISQHVAHDTKAPLIAHPYSGRG